jgi:hypothetical protein
MCRFLLQELTPQSADRIAVAALMGADEELALFGRVRIKICDMWHELRCNPVCA